MQEDHNSNPTWRHPAFSLPHALFQMSSKWKTGGGQAGQQGSHLAWGGRHWAVLSVSEFPWRGNSRSSLMCQPEPRPSPRDYSTGLKMNCQFPSHCPLLNFSHFSWWWFNIIFSCSDSSSLSCGYLCVWGFKDGFSCEAKVSWRRGALRGERGDLFFFHDDPCHVHLELADMSRFFYGPESLQEINKCCW